VKFGYKNVLVTKMVAKKMVAKMYFPNMSKKDEVNFQYFSVFSDHLETKFFDSQAYCM
jgi:hypothetical protein